MAVDCQQLHYNFKSHVFTLHHTIRAISLHYITLQEPCHYGFPWEPITQPVGNWKHSLPCIFTSKTTITQIYLAALHSNVHRNGNLDIYCFIFESIKHLAQGFSCNTEHSTQDPYFWHQRLLNWYISHVCLHHLLCGHFPCLPSQLICCLEECLSDHQWSLEEIQPIQHFSGEFILPTVVLCSVLYSVVLYATVMYCAVWFTLRCSAVQCCTIQ